MRNCELPIESTNPGPGCLQYTPLAYPPVLCCGGASNRILPYFIMNMWMATRDNGLAATLYGPSTVSALVGPRVGVKVRTVTDYPFGDTIRMTVGPDHPVAFPLELRIPDWCAKPAVQVNGATVAAEPVADRKGFVRIRRQWAKGDTVTLTLPMSARIELGQETEYPAALRRYFRIEPDSIFQPRRLPYASVIRGPLLFALPIADVDPNTPVADAKWQYALDIAPARAAQITVERKPLPAHWDWPLDAPIALAVPARAFDWKPTNAQALPSEPVTGGRSEIIRLIPYGCAKFHISMFPVTPQVLVSGENQGRVKE
jgi:hypothetical protein